MRGPISDATISYALTHPQEMCETCGVMGTPIDALSGRPASEQLALMAGLPVRLFGGRCDDCRESVTVAT